MRGRDVNLDIIEGQNRVMTIRPVDEGGELWDFGSMMVYGELRDERDEEKLAELECKVTGDGLIEVKFPVMELGRYVFIIEGSSETGERERLMNGMVGYQVPEIEEIELEDTPERSITLYVNGERRRALWNWSTASESAYLKILQISHEIDKKLEKAGELVNEGEGVVDSALEALRRAQAFMKSFDEALYDCIKIVDNYLYIGNYPTGHYLRGDDGITPHIGTDGYWYLGTKKLVRAEGKDGLTPYITSTGYWAIGDKITNVRAQGRDGLDGTAIRRILVDSYEEIPQSGETCNGGYIYYVPRQEEVVMRQASSKLSGESEDNYSTKADIVYKAHRSCSTIDGVLRKIGIKAGNDNGKDELCTDAAYAHVFYQEAGGWLWAGVSLTPESQVADAITWWDFSDLNIPLGADVRVVLSTSSAADDCEDNAVNIRVKVIPTSDGSTINGNRYCPVTFWQCEGEVLEKYDIYAWLVDNGWVKVSMAYDIASDRQYGLTKLGTARQVEKGAPVGTDITGAMAVPIADAGVPGTVLPSSIKTDKSGGYVHVDEDGKVWVDIADPSNAGAVKLSYSAECENTNSIGRTSDNKIAVPRAEAFQWGVVKIGTTVPQSLGMPWIIPVGMAAQDTLNEYGQNITGQLFNNVIKGGALRTYTKAGWELNSPPGVDVSLLPDDSNAVGILTSSQFKQTTANGLTLNTASQTLLAGVYIANGIDDSRANAATNAILVKEVRNGLRQEINAVYGWAETNFYKKEFVYTKTETASYVASALAPYATINWVQSNYYTKADVNYLLAQKLNAHIGKAETLYVMTEEERRNVNKVDSKGLYLIYAD